MMEKQSMGMLVFIIIGILVVLIAASVILLMRDPSNATKLFGEIIFWIPGLSTAVNA